MYLVPGVQKYTGFVDVCNSIDMNNFHVASILKSFALGQFSL